MQDQGNVLAQIDVTQIVTGITGAISTVTSIGLAVLSVYVALKSFTWVRSAFR